MSGSLLLWCVLALAICWMVGLYGRLTRLRNDALKACGIAYQQMELYSRVLDQHLGPLELNKNDEQYIQRKDIYNDWAELIAAIAALEQVLQEAHRAPMQNASTNEIRATVDSVHVAWKHRCEIPADLAGPAVPEPMRQQWEETSAGVRSACSACNRTLTEYNQALEQFPARMLAGVMHFETAELL